MRNQHLIVSGIPASGKSTLARSLSDELGLEMLDKDEILEDLFDEKGIGDVHWRTTLSRTADEILRERASRSESSIIVSWWRHPGSTIVSGTPIEWLSDLPGVLIEINCICDPAIAVKRFQSRTRHRGHLDQFKSSTDLLAAFQQQAALGPLGIGRHVEVNTEATVELAEVLSSIILHQHNAVE
jgi:adenylate kinase family enzyme